LIVAGVLNVEGRISANGNGSPGSGGSGGSIYLTVGSLTGSGAITANGGNHGGGNHGGGGGGRIAIEYEDDTFTGTITAIGGVGYRYGGAGTIYTKADDAAQGDLLIDNGGTWGAWTPITSPEAFNVSIANRAVVYPTAPLVLNNLNVLSDGFLTHLSGDDTFHVTVNGESEVALGGSINVDGRGYGPDTGPGTGANGYYDSGGGYGGQGGNSDSMPGGSAYGSVLTPTELGSGGGGGGGAGGGAIRLIVAGVLRVEGDISANGNDSSHSGGSGGSIYLTVGSLAGTGVITANGGNHGGGNHGGGGGGRIAIEYGSDAFAGTITAFGGVGYQ
jgi:hypothetical protein